MSEKGSQSGKPWACLCSSILPEGASDTCPKKKKKHIIKHTGSFCTRLVRSSCCGQPHVLQYCLTQTNCGKRVDYQATKNHLDSARATGSSHLVLLITPCAVYEALYLLCCSAQGAVLVAYRWQKGQPDDRLPSHQELLRRGQGHRLIPLCVAQRDLCAEATAGVPACQTAV